MAKKNQTLKEIIQIVVFLLVVGILAWAFVIYPLGRTKEIMGREHLDDYTADSTLPNDPAVFVEAGLTVDTFRIESDGLTTLACLSLTPELEAPDSAEISCRGTVFLLHDERSDRSAMLPAAQMLLDAGFCVVTYDQRASGLSSGEYHGDGQYEAADLDELVRYLDIRNQITHPLSVVGWGVGAEAALLAAHEESRIDNVVAVAPFLTSERMIDTYREQYDTYWLPFFRTLFWWWYNTRSSYAAGYRDTEDIRGVATRTLILADESATEDEDFARLKELSEAGKLTIETTPTDSTVVLTRILTFLTPEPSDTGPKAVQGE